MISQLLGWAVPFFLSVFVLWLTVTGRIVPATKAVTSWAGMSKPVEKPTTELPERYLVANDLNRSLFDVVEAAERDAVPQKRIGERLQPPPPSEPLPRDMWPTYCRRGEHVIDQRLTVVGRCGGCNQTEDQIQQGDA